MALDQYKYTVEEADIKFERSLNTKLLEIEGKIEDAKKILIGLLEEKVETFRDLERNCIEYDEKERKKTEEEIRELKEIWKIGTKEQSR